MSSIFYSGPVTWLDIAFFVVFVGGVAVIVVRWGIERFRQWLKRWQS